MIPYNILGVGVYPVDRSALLSTLLEWVREPENGTAPRLVSYVNAHCLNVAAQDEEYRLILNRCAMIYSDGIGVVWASRFLGGPKMYKVTGRDWIEDFCRLSTDQGLRIYILGGQPGVAAKAAAHLVARFPSLQVVGVDDGYFIGKSETEVLEKIERQQPDVLFVGMGVPLQEKWIARNLSHIHARVCWLVGALFDYIAGDEPLVPKWMDRLALEWLWRLMIDPRGKWRRYVVGNPLFLIRLLKQKLG